MLHSARPPGAGPAGRPVPARPGARLPRRLGKHLPRRRQRACAAVHAAGAGAGARRASTLPDVAALQALRLAATAPAGASAAPWIHLYALQLLLLVVLPRWLLALWAGWRARWLQRSCRCRWASPISSGCCASSAAAARCCACGRIARTPTPRRWRRCARCWRACFGDGVRTADRAHRGLRRRGDAGRQLAAARRAAHGAVRPGRHARAGKPGPTAAGPGRAPAGRRTLCWSTKRPSCSASAPTSPRRAERRAGLAGAGRGIGCARGVRRAARGRPGGGASDAADPGAAGRGGSMNVRARQPAAEPGVAHQRRQDHAGAHAARPRCRRGARRAACHRSSPTPTRCCARRRARRCGCGTRPASATACGCCDRMRQAGNPLGWFLSQVWDRWRDRPFWASQQALRHVAETSRRGAVPGQRGRGAAGRRPTWPARWSCCAWVGKPVIVLLNQLGMPREARAGSRPRWSAGASTWRRFDTVAQVLPLDAFARCWVQEGVLLQAIEACLQGERRALMQRLRAAWQDAAAGDLRRSVDKLAHSMARLAAARQELAERRGCAQVAQARRGAGPGAPTSTTRRCWRRRRWPRRSTPRCVPAPRS